METDKRIEHDLALSGITAEDIHARIMSDAERQACALKFQVEGYVIPYFSIVGKPLPFYRVRLFDYNIKYKQIKNTSNHVYFPPDFMAVYNSMLERFPEGQQFCILTEGEKKAVAACKAGFPAIAFGGVDSWNNRILLIPKDAEMAAYSYNRKLVGAKLPSNTRDMVDVVLGPVAHGFEDLANLLLRNRLHAIIIYDTDEMDDLLGVKPEVQRAASDLAFELRRRGVPLSHLRQLILPGMPEMEKTGLDDFLHMYEDGPAQLTDLIRSTIGKRSAFPRHPNMQGYLNKKLQSAKLDRKDLQRVALNIITDLDARGVRMMSKEAEQLYYFEEQDRRLIKVDLATDGNHSQNTPFAKLLYQYYGLSISADTRVVKWLDTQFAGEDPIEKVTPHRVIARGELDEDAVRYQINDGQYVKVTGDPNNPIQILHNGTENVLFEAEQVAHVDADELLTEFAKRQQEPLTMWWKDVLQEVRLKDHGKTATVLGLLYYISPWLHRWRGTQLPAELVIGEAGSGKSTLCELRLNILTGKPDLRNAPTDLKDWYSSVTNTGGLHVIDNLQLLDKNLRQRMSDEICRLITAPDPHIEQRKYYTNADLIHIRVDTVFGFTAITQPFTNSDLLQRSIKVELDKLAHDGNDPTKVSYDSMWKKKQLERFGGRAAWISHHLYVLHRLLEHIDKKWSPNYRARHRLINVEQLFIVLGDLFGLDVSWIPGYLAGHTDESIVESDWVLEGIQAFCKQHRKDPNVIPDFLNMTGNERAGALQGLYTSKDIAAWACSQEDYMDAISLTNARKLGRYLQTHKSLVAQTCNLIEHGKLGNRLTYIVRPVKE